MSEKDFTKEFFQQAWGPNGYYEDFSYGVGIDKVCEVALTPFLDPNKTAIEIGCGGGTFTKRMAGKFQWLLAVDVIKEPAIIQQLRDAGAGISYAELDNQQYNLKGLKNDDWDFCFSYNVFCHLSNEAIDSYVESVFDKLKSGCDFVFMLSKFEHAAKHFPDTASQYKRGDMLPTGHFYQDNDTVNLIIRWFKWEIISYDMIPEHRDRIVHLRKK